MTFVIPAAQALGCATELRRPRGDSARESTEPSGPTRDYCKKYRETKIEQIRKFIVFQTFDPPCQTRTKKVQNGRDYGLSGLH
jgi:hypothetical protein